MWLMGRPLAGRKRVWVRRAAPHRPGPVGCPSGRRWPRVDGGGVVGPSPAGRLGRRARRARVRGAAERMPVTVVSLGDCVLNGGEVAVLAMVEAIVRLVPGVVGNAESLVEESTDGLLEYPVYTQTSHLGRPRHRASRAADPVVRQPLRDRAVATPTAAGAHRRPPTRPASTLGHGRRLGRPGRPRGHRCRCPELLTLQRACWVDQGRANDTWDIRHSSKPSTTCAPGSRHTRPGCGAAAGDWSPAVGVDALRRPDDLGGRATRWRLLTCRAQAWGERS